MKFVYLFMVFLLLGSMMLEIHSSCICTADYSPVCGTNGRTYSNRCNLDCDRAKLAYTGECGSNM